MSIDMRTVELTLTVAYLFFGLLMLALWCQRRNEPAPLLWGLHNLAAGLGHLALAVGEPTLGGWTDSLAVAWIAFSELLLWAGIRRFAGRPLPAISIWLFPPVLGLFVKLFSVPGENLIALILLHSVLLTLMSLACLYETWSSPLLTRFAMRRLALAAYLLTLGFALARAVAAIYGPPPTDYLEAGPQAAMIQLLALSLIMLWNIALLLLNSERSERRLAELARSDALTGALNRGGFRSLASRHLDRCRRDRKPATVLLMDLDYFKRVNDTYGHEGGDRVLQAFAEIAGQVIRPSDLLARYGGEEFVALLPGSTAAEAAAVAERLRARFEVLRIEPGIGTTVSIGVAELNHAGEDSLDAALARADQALYAAKRTGRNRVITDGAPLGDLSVAPGLQPP